MALEREEAKRRKRYYHTDLRPLATTHTSLSGHLSNSPGRGYGISASPASSSSAISLASPSLAAVRKYYRNHGLRTAFQTEPPAMDHIVRFPESLPRRHSILSPGGLAVRLERIAVTSPMHGARSEHVRERRSIAEVSRDMLLDGVNRSELAKLGGVVSRRPSTPHPSILSSISARISADPTHDRLRAWGPAYLGNATVADFYVKAVQLRRLDQKDNFSRNEASEQGGLSEKYDHPVEVILSTIKSGEITVRARVLPRAKERKPFLIQRRFNLDDMRASTSVSKAGAKPELRFLPNHDSDKEVGYSDTQTTPERSKSDSSAKPLQLHAESRASSSPQDRIPAAKISRTAGRRIMVMPIHVEYALHYLPVLAGLVFSGHIRKGDAIDLPIPNPWAWHEVVSYIYTGQGLVTPAMKENILYLGGRVDE